MDSPGDSMPSLPSSDDCKTSEDLPAVIDVPTKCNGMGDSDQRAATDISPLSTRTDAPSGGDELNDSDSAINAIDMFLAEKGSDGREGEGDSVALVGEQEVESEASNIEGEVSRSQHSSDSSSNVAHRPDSGNSDSNATPSCGDDSSTQPPPDESGETTKDREGLEKEDLVLTDTETETEHLAIHQKDEVDAEPVYASEAMRAFHSVVIAPVTEQRVDVEPTSPMDVEMATEASLVGVNEDSITGDTGGLGKVTGVEEDMDVTEPGSETHSEDVAKQQNEDEEMEVDETRPDLVGTDELASGVLTEAASVPADGSEDGYEDGYDDVDAGGKGDSADSRTEPTERDTPPKNESTDVSQSDPVSVETKTSALGSLEDQLLGNSSTDVDVKDATEIEGEMLNIASKVKETSDIDVALDTDDLKAGDETDEKCQETAESGNTATGSSKKDNSETVKDEVSCTQSTDEASVTTESVKIDKQTVKVDKGGVQSDVIVLDGEEQGKDPATAGSNIDSAVETPKKSTEKQLGQVKEKKELQDYAAGVADEFLGMLGMDKLDASEKAELAVGVESTTATGTSTTTEQKTATTTPTTPTTPTSTGSGKATSLLPATAPKSPPKTQQECIVCNLVGKCKYNIVRNGDIKHLCDDNCFKVFRANPTKYLRTRPATAVSTHQPSFICAFCHTGITATTKDQFTLKVGKELKRFCNAGCCDEFKKRQKLCSQCGKDVTTNADAFMAPVGSDSAFRDFCSQACLRKFEKNTKNEDADVEITGTSRVTGPRTRSKANQSKCAVCNKMGPVMHEITFGGKLNKLCSQPCFVAFRYANKLTVSKCEHCGKSCYLDGSATQSIQFEGQLRHFCTATCTMRFKANKTKMVGCAWCQARKSNFDMIERVDANNKYQLFCSLNCLSLYRVNLQATSNQSVSCDQCHKYAPAQYHLTMSDASVRNFCSYECVMAFQAQFASGTSSPSSSGGRASQPKPQGNRAIQSQPVTNNKTTTRHSPRGLCCFVSLYLRRVVFLIQQGEDDGAVATATMTAETSEAALKTTVQVMPESATKKPTSVFTNALGLVERTAKVKKSTSATSDVAFGQGRVNLLQTPVKRGRGRPRKSPLTAVSAEIAAAKAAASANAVVLVEPVSASNNNAKTVTLAKTSEPASARDVLPKRPRGRPRKSSLPSGATTMTQLKIAPKLTKSNADNKMTTDIAPLVSGDVQIHRVTTGKIANKTRQRRKKTKLPLKLDLSEDPRRSGRHRKLTYKFAEIVASTKQAIAPAPASNDSIPVISNVVSLAPEPQTSGTTSRGKPAATTKQSNSTSTQMVTEQIIVKPPPPKQVRNKSLLCKPFVQTKATSCRPHTQSKCTQTNEEWKPRPHIIPVPVPIYVPVPMALYNYPTPYPLPIPIPIPVPCFIPTTKKSAPSILKHMKEIQERMPADPFEAELLMMAETLATAEKGSDNDSDSDDDDVPPMTDLPVETAEPVRTDTTVAIATSAEQATEFGEDMLQMALRMASEMPADEQALELAGSLAPSAINTTASLESGGFGTIDAEGVGLSVTRGGKRRLTRTSTNSNKRSKVAPVTSEPAAVTESPDANMVLKYMFGVGEWKRWVQQKNTQLEQASEERRTTRLKLFKTDILQCTADELNFSLCLFVKEVRKPDNEEYSPDSVFYMCVGIQQYLFENSRIDNIFTDIYFEKFTGCLNDLLTNYTVRLNAQGEIVCRMEEEHLWESRQLGAHSPYVLLNTLIYFNTRYFHLRNVDDHLHLSFSHIMKHWKKLNVTGSKTPGRSVYLRYYVPSTLGVDASGVKRKKEELPVFEQGENADNPLRCPVKLYEFYLSKCPESIKNRNDVFYLVPERSCVPDSPVWYSTQSLGAESMNKMLNRVRLIKEIQEVQLQEVP